TITMIGLIRRLGKFCKEFNVFETDATDTTSIDIQRWSTRIYIFLLLFCISGLLLDRGLRVETQLVEVENPSVELYMELQETHSDISCLCSQISVAYGSFVELNLIYESVCSSGFVSQTWIEMLVNDITTQGHPGDFRASASLMFQVLQGLCNRVKSILDVDSQSFYDTKFVSNYLVNENILNVSTENIINEFLNNSYTNFNHSISFLHSFMHGNLLVSGIGTTAVTFLQSIDGYSYQWGVIARGYLSPQFPEGCMCDHGDNCSIPSGFYNSTVVDNLVISYWDNEADVSFIMKNWFVSCSALNSLLMSSFEESFLYNQTALNLIDMYYSWSSNSVLPDVLNLNESNKTNETKGTFSDHLQTLFVKGSPANINYSLYYAQCKPQSCSYSAPKKASFLYLLILFLSLYGGLSVPLQFIVPYIVNLLMRRLRRTTETHADVEVSTTTETSKSLRERVQKIKSSIWHSLIELNLFQSSIRRQPTDIKQQRYSTRIYIICLVMALVWEAMIRALRETGYLYVLRNDFRYSYEFFYLLNELCQLSEVMIVSSLETFKQTQLVTNDLLSDDLFTNQMNSIVKQFQSDLPQTFFRFFQLVRNITYANQIFAFINNVQYELIDSPLTKVSFSINGFQGINGNTSYTCSCANDINCNTKMRLFTLSDSNPSNITIPGLYIACTMYESLLQSTFECFYDDQDCLMTIINFYNSIWFQPQDFSLLNSSIPSRFPRNSSINSISSELFIEFWNQSLNYSSYFAHCQPQSCSYTILQRNNLITTITIIIGLIGGLSASLRIIVPVVVKIYFYLIGRRQNQSVVSEPTGEFRNVVMRFNICQMNKTKMVEF
ncbi:unnamed protein product, partial [Adineta steineri]